MISFGNAASFHRGLIPLKTAYKKKRRIALGDRYSLKMTTAQVVETSVTVNNNSPIQDYVHPDDQTQPTFNITLSFRRVCRESDKVYFTFNSIPLQENIDQIIHLNSNKKPLRHLC